MIKNIDINNSKIQSINYEDDMAIRQSINEKNEDTVYDIESINSSEINPKNEKDYRCAPSLNFEHGSCIPLDIFIEMAITYNDTYDDKIRLSSKLETLNPAKYKKFLVKQFNEKFKNSCDNQRCWLKQSYLKNLNINTQNKLKNNIFRPKGPQGKFTWLNTLNIDGVMKQYEEKYKTFKFLGAVPADFEDLEFYGIKDLDFDKLIKDGKTKIGMVMNLDEYGKSGSHWVSLFSDLEKGKIYYSDSYGIKPEKRFRRFMRKIARYCRDKLLIPENKLKVDYNKTRHQKGNSECGVYSINFILRLLKGDSFYDITSNRIPDTAVNKCRNVYFS